MQWLGLVQPGGRRGGVTGGMPRVQALQVRLETGAAACDGGPGAWRAWSLEGRRAGGPADATFAACQPYGVASRRIASRVAGIGHPRKFVAPAARRCALHHARCRPRGRSAQSTAQSAGSTETMHRCKTKINKDTALH